MVALPIAPINWLRPASTIFSPSTMLAAPKFKTNTVDVTDPIFSLVEDKM